MIFEKHIRQNKTDFIARVLEISGKLGINPDWLMAVMKFESDLDHANVNSGSGATGLIQFMPFVYKDYGLSQSELQNMSNVKQLDYVYKYFLPYKGKINSFTDAYLTVFFPLAVGKPDSYVLGTAKTKPETIAKQNPSFDTDKNKVVTAGEIRGFLRKKFIKELSPADFAILFPKQAGGVVLGILSAAAIIYALTKI